jgi:cysteinyl-tRNA synthetase
MESEKRIPSKEELIDKGIFYHVEKKEIYFSVKELKKQYSFLKTHKADRKEFKVEEKSFTGIKIQNVFI